MIDPKLVATYKRLAGRRDMNMRNADAEPVPVDHDVSYACMNAYQNAINNLCDAFQTTEDELTKAAEVA